MAGPRDKTWWRLEFQLRGHRTTQFDDVVRDVLESLWFFGNTFNLDLMKVREGYWIGLLAEPETLEGIVI